LAAPFFYLGVMKKLFSFCLLFFVQVVLFAQNADTTYTGVDTTLASYKLGQQIGAWFPFVMLTLLVLLYIRSAYRFDKKKKGLD